MILLKSLTFTLIQAVMDNGPAMKENFAHNLQSTGDVFGDPFEVSTMRKEDHEVIKDKSGEFVEILQLPHLPAARIRGHQYAGAFLQAVSTKCMENIFSENVSIFVSFRFQD